jgi:4-amino-4-deoxychorismate lyase
MTAPRIEIPLDAPAQSRGVGFFETLWVLEGRPVFARGHWQRLVASCRALEVPPPASESARKAIEAALAAAPRRREAAMRWSYLAVGRDLGSQRAWKFFAMVFPVPPESRRRRLGARAITLPRGWQRLTPKWKTIDYRASVAGVRRARRRGANEALFVDPRGRVLEGTASNVFLVAGRRLLTPPERAGILPGIVRGWVRTNARRAGLTLRETLFPAGRLREGAFLTASLTGLAPLVSLDGRRCLPPGPGFERLRDLYLADARREASRAKLGIR